MWAFLCMEHVRAVYHHVRRTQGRRGWKAPGVRGGGAASGGESFPGSLQISTRFVCFPTFGYVYLSHFVQFIFVDVNALV